MTILGAKWRRTLASRVFTALAALVASLAGTVVVAGVTPAAAEVPPRTLWAVGFDGSSWAAGDYSPVSLYTVDASTGQATKVAAINFANNVAVLGLTNIAFSSTGVLYAASTYDQALLTINTTTGVASVVGSFGESGGFPDLAFDGEGTLYGWNEQCPDCLNTISTSDGSISPVGASGISTRSTGLAVNSSDEMYVKTDTTIYPVDASTGATTSDGVALHDASDTAVQTANSMDFSPSQVLFGLVRPGQYANDGQFGATGSTLLTIDPTTGLVEEVGNDSDVMLRAIAFERGPTLYGVGARAVDYSNWGGSAQSNLYTIDTFSGKARFVASITLNNVPVYGITGIDIDPLTGVLYGVNSQTGQLLTIDKTTGVATLVGSFGDNGGWFSDISFDTYGYLYGWDKNQGVLDRIYPDGTTRQIGTTANGSGGIGLATLADNTMLVKTGWDLYGVSPQTGVLDDTAVGLSDFTYNAADADPSDTLYTVYRGGNYNSSTTLETIDRSTGTVTPVSGPDTNAAIFGIAFDNPVVSAPGSNADVALTKSVDNAHQKVGLNVTFTIDVENLNGDDANVDVSDLLPTGYTYVSSNAGVGTYDGSTGAWAIGTLSAGSSAELTITATVRATGVLTNTAAFSSDVYNPGPTKASATVAPPAPAVVSTTPTNGATGVALKPTITVTFDQPILTATMSLSTGKRTRVTAVLTDVTGSVATFSVSSKLARLTTYSLDVRGESARYAWGAWHPFSFTTGTGR